MMQRFFRGPSFPKIVTLAVALLIAATPTWAGEFFEKNGVALRGFDVVAYFSDKKPVMGLAEHYNRDVQEQWSTGLAGGALLFVVM